MKIKKEEISGLRDFLEKTCFDTPFVGTLDEIMEKLGRDKGNTFPFTITIDEKPAGFFTVSLSDLKIDFLQGDKTNCWIESFFIAEKFQGKGIAKETIKMMPEAIVRKFPQIKNISLTVNKKNKAAISLYLKSGFQDTFKTYEGGPFGPQHIFTMNLLDEV